MDGNRARAMAHYQVLLTRARTGTEARSLAEASRRSFLAPLLGS